MFWKQSMSEHTYRHNILIIEKALEHMQMESAIDFCVFIRSRYQGDGLIHREVYKESTWIGSIGIAKLEENETVVYIISLAEEFDGTINKIRSALDNFSYGLDLLHTRIEEELQLRSPIPNAVEPAKITQAQKEMQIIEPSEDGDTEPKKPKRKSLLPDWPSRSGDGEKWVVAWEILEPQIEADQTLKVDISALVQTLKSKHLPMERETVKKVLAMGTAGKLTRAEFEKNYKLNFD